MSRFPPSAFRQLSAGFLPLMVLFSPSCSTTKSPPPAVELRTVEIKVPVPAPCLAKDAIPAEPERIASRLTGDARHDLDLVSASALRLREWGRGMKAALEACAR